MIGIALLGSLSDETRCIGLAGQDNPTALEHDPFHQFGDVIG